MDKLHKRSNKHPKNKKNQPLKVVYIANPIKFKTSVSEFRALVQELTGQDSDVPDSTRFTADDGVSGRRGEVANAVKVAAEASVHDVTKIEYSSSNGYEQAVENGSVQSIFGSYDDVFWHEAAHDLDVLKNLN
ncbi:hypothetical protein BUALT_Bualt12G0033200 [Buddleja alternifolia]|uniref:VQ domain-containing protein n=1 Tax=Buddleja alternifolia TaxID=168488 RepID=A0AAV6WNQ4_9LAMI|nr:hypothetical protein BUALT_Bualt12G0033200 [Buddleja alternifolia]